MNKNKFRSFVNSVISIYGVLTFDELYTLNKEFKFNFTKKELYNLCLRENNEESIYDYIFSGIETAVYKIRLNSDNKLIIHHKEMEFEKAKELLNFKYPIYFEYILNKNDLDYVSKNKINYEYHDIIPGLIYEFYDSLTKEEIDKFVKCSGIKSRSKKDLRKIICSSIYYELFYRLNHDYSSLCSNETIDEYINRLINNYDGGPLKIDSTCFVFLPLEKAEELIHVNFSMIRRIVLRGYSEEEIERLEKLDSLVKGKEYLLEGIAINERLFYTSLDLDNDLGMVEEYKSTCNEKEARDFQELMDIIRENF